MSRLKPIQIGPVRIETPVILAPMTGVTDKPFRRIVKRYGAGLTVTEMIASQAAIRETRQSLQKMEWDPSEEPVSTGVIDELPWLKLQPGQEVDIHGTYILNKIDIGIYLSRSMFISRA